MARIVLAIIAITMVVPVCGCKKKEPPRPAQKVVVKKTQSVRFRKPLLISNIGKKEIKTLAVFYNDEAFVIRNLKPDCAVQEVMTPNTTTVDMQFFITYIDDKQIVVPKSRWNFTPDVLTGLRIGDGGIVSYRK